MSQKDQHKAMVEAAREAARSDFVSERLAGLWGARSELEIESWPLSYAAAYRHEGERLDREGI